MIAGIDFSTKAVDVVLLDEDTDAATWHRFELEARGKLDDAFERTRAVRDALPTRTGGFWDDVAAVGIEQPRGYDAYTGMRVQGAILACLPVTLLVHPLNPSEWRKTVGLPGNASKGLVRSEGLRLLINAHAVLEIDMARVHAGIGGPRPVRRYPPWIDDWPQDAFDAYLIALATRSVVLRSDAAEGAA